MSIDEVEVMTISVPGALIPDLENFSGPVLFYMDRMVVRDGFTLADDEFVTSVREMSESPLVAGLLEIIFAKLPSQT